MQFTAKSLDGDCQIDFGFDDIDCVFPSDDVMYIRATLGSVPVLLSSIKCSVHVLIGQREGHQSVLAVKATHEEAKKADYRFSEFWETDIEEWTIGEELSEPRDQVF